MPNISLEKNVFVCFLQKTEDKNEKKINIPVDMKSKNVFYTIMSLCRYVDFSN